jgi:hypothetical protein
MPVHTVSDERERFFRRPPWRLTLPLVALVASLALIVWTIPNWGAFAQNVAQFSALWESNQQTIILLCLKVSAPLSLALLMLGWCWLVYSAWCWLVYSPEREASPATSEDRQVLQQASYTPHRPYGSPDPITPLPPTLSNTQLYTQVTPPGELQLPLQPFQNGTQVTFTVAAPGPLEQVQATSDQVYVHINLLQDVQMVLYAPGPEGQSWSWGVDLKSNFKRMLLLAYIAHLQGNPVERNKMLNAVFLPGRTGAEAEIERLVSAFNDQKKALREALREAGRHLNDEVGREVVPEGLDVFANANMNWWLDRSCRVTDLATVEDLHQRIEQAEREGRMAGCVPVDVNAACQALIQAYRGDFLSALIALQPREFEPWNGKSSWARKPFTDYRDYFLQALWYAAGYELQMGQQVNAALGDDAREAQRAHFERAARLYGKYAMYACNTRFDANVVAGKSSAEPSVRVGMSEYALRSCLILNSVIGANSHLINQVYADYETQMKRKLGSEWHPSQETKIDLEAAVTGKSTYRLPLPVVPHGPFPYNLAQAR